MGSSPSSPPDTWAVWTRTAALQCWVYYLLLPATCFLDRVLVGSQKEELRGSFL